jgi:hypothetical protein
MKNSWLPSAIIPIVFIPIVAAARSTVDAPQVVNPATAGNEFGQQEPDERPHTYDMPPVEVFGRLGKDLRSWRS